jgi:hypothetical protein
MGESQAVLSSWQVISWWEWRRIIYNLLLLAIGVAAIAGFEFLMERAIPPGEDAVEPFGMLLGVAAFAFMANVCYSLGWVIELLQRENNPARARANAEKGFRRGLLFSCLLTTAPFWYACLYLLLHPGQSR